jgi:Spy/CpxP family protein refolding chaperone
MAGMKSALELAMEKINAQRSQADTPVSLTDAQRQEISDLRKQYDAKIAEKDVMLQADIRQLMQRRPPQEVLAAAQELREKFQQTKKALQEELEAKIATVRTRA